MTSGATDLGAERGASTDAIAARRITKVFPGTRALDEVDLTLRWGEVHGLCGGNGCGKSTLIKILSGVQPADSGTVTVDGTRLDASAVRAGSMRDLGVRVVHQDLALFPDLTVAENLLIGADFPTTGPRIRWREVERTAREQIELHDIPARPDALLRTLPIGARSQVAIARALRDVTSGRAIVILDEPTAALPAHEVDHLLGAMRKLAGQGHAIVFVSHRLNEVTAVTDRVTVMRDGRVSAEHVTAELTEDELIESILGRRGEAVRGRTEVRTDAPEVLRISGLDAGPLTEIDLTVRAGEVVGIAGQLGSGRTELLRAIYGDLRRWSGDIVVNGRATDFSRIDQAIAAGVVMIQEDRPGQSVLPDASVEANMDIGVLRQYWRGLGFRRPAMRRDAADLRARFRVKAVAGSAMSALSGGNQQKAILARWLRRKPVLMLLDEPTQGVDVGARTDIYGAVRDVLDETGGAALVVTSDLEELVQVVDRAVVLRKGRVVAHLEGAELTAHRLNLLINDDGESA